MKNKKLTLDKDRLVRLQNDQLNAATGGEDRNGSTKVTVKIGRVADTSSEDSCCNKSCTNAD